MPHQAFSDRVKTRIHERLAAYLPAETQQPTRLHQAMRYAALNPGKRLRPTLVYAAGDLFDVPWQQLDAPAVAVELIHAYSLVHDDLPCMDNDDLRRGLPTCHVAFDEATAVLAGDALQTLAFQVVAQASDLSAEVKIKLLAELSSASGSLGMGGGQAIDLQMTDSTDQPANYPANLTTLQSMHRMKTGALITAAVQMGCIVSGISDQKVLECLRIYADCLGLAFQIRDDILDVETDTETLGKPQGSDQAKNKLTFPALLGIQGAKNTANELIEKGLTALNQLPYDTKNLAAFANYVIQRDY